MARDDDTVLGIKLDESPDSDGDGVSDLQERLAGTDPRDAADHPLPEPTREPTLTTDPRADLDPAVLDPETPDPRTAMPTGMNTDTVLVGMTNLDGSSIPRGPGHHGVAEFDALLDGHAPGNSPLDVNRNPLAPAGGGQSGSGNSAPPGIRDKYDLVSDEADEFELPTPYVPPTPPLMDPSPPPAPPAEQDRDTPALDKEAGYTDPADPPQVPNVQVMTDGEGRAAGPTVEEVERAITLKGADTKPVNGDAGGRPEVSADDIQGRFEPVTDGGDDDAGASFTTAPRITTAGPDGINPDSGFAPQAGGDGPPPTGGGGDDILTGMSSATASSAESDAPSISLVGDNDRPSGIHAVPTSDDGSADPGNNGDLVSASGGDDDDLEELEVQRSTNPDADPEGTSVESIDRAITVRDGATDVVRGGGIQIEGDAPPGTPPSLVGDPRDDIDGLDTTTAPTLNRAGPEGIRPDLGLDLPPIGGATPGGDDLLADISSATAGSGESDAPTLRLVDADDNQPSSIQSLESETDATRNAERSSESFAMKRDDPSSGESNGGGSEGGSTSADDPPPAETATPEAPAATPVFPVATIAGVVAPLVDIQVVSTASTGSDFQTAANDPITGEATLYESAPGPSRHPTAESFVDDGGESGVDAVDTFAAGFLADAPIDDIQIIIPETDRDADPFATIEPLEHSSFVDADVDLPDAPEEASDLFGNDPALDG